MTGWGDRRYGNGCGLIIAAEKGDPFVRILTKRLGEIPNEAFGKGGRGEFFKIVFLKGLNIFGINSGKTGKLLLA